MSLVIHALPAGIIRGYPTAALTYQRGWGETMDIPLIMFAITGGPHPVIVDTGAPPPDRVRRWHGITVDRSADQEPLAALHAIGVDPLDVRIVINTHLHWDHAGNNDLFPEATFLVQRTEFEYAQDPLPPNRVAYEVSNGISPSWLPLRDRFVLLDGAAGVTDGISVIALPGHTPGCQGVVVDTAERRFLIAGDCVNLYQNWEGDRKLEHIANGSFVDLRAHYASFQAIKETGAEVIPSHDPRVLVTRRFG